MPQQRVSPEDKRGDVFGGLLRMLLPAIGTGLANFNKTTQPIRDYYNPILGPGQNLRRQVAGINLPSLSRQNFIPPGQTVRQTLLGERGDLAVADFLEDRVEKPLTRFGSYMGDIWLNTKMLETGLPGYLLPRESAPKMPNYNPVRAFRVPEQRS